MGFTSALRETSCLLLLHPAKTTDWRSVSLHLFTQQNENCNVVNGNCADLTGLVDLLKDWTAFHQSLSSLPTPVVDRQSILPVSPSSCSNFPSVLQIRTDTLPCLYDASIYNTTVVIICWLNLVGKVLPQHARASA